MNTIIAPTDFSPASLNAVNYAAGMAVSKHATLLLMHVIQMPQIISEAPLPASLFSSIQDEAEKYMSALKKKMQKRTKNSIPVLAKCVDGDTGLKIVEMSKQKRPFAVVMAPKGTVEFRKVITGSTTLYAAKHLNYPLLIVPPNASFRKIRKIAYASDLMSENTAGLVKILKDWLKNFEAKLDVVHITDAAVVDMPQSVEYAALQKHLPKSAVHFHFIKGSSVFKSISEFIEKTKPQILVIMNREKRFSERLVYKTEFKKIIRHAAIPVMVIPR